MGLCPLFYFNALSEGIFLKAGDVESKVIGLAEPLINNLGLELIDVEYLFEHGSMVLRVYIDGPDGVGVEECTSVSRELSMLLDVEEVIAKHYSLEVSSPGLNRPLKRRKDFLKVVGEKVSIKMKAAVEGRKNFKATLESVGDDDRVVVVDSDGKKWEIAIADISKANLEYVF